MKQNQDLNAVLQYLKKESIFIDETEFEYQYSSHPEYPSLLAVSDTLSFFKVYNMAFRISNVQLEELPKNFIAVLKQENKDKFSYISKDESTFLVDGTKFSKEKFIIEFQNIVLLAEKDKNFADTNAKSHFLEFSLLVLSFILFSSCFFFSHSSLIAYSLLLTAIAGLYLSTETFRQILGLKEGIASKFCNVTAETSCENILTSKKWKLFDIFNLSDISIVFFASQIIAIILFSLLNLSSLFFSLLSIGSWLVVPLSILSIYYQWKVEKKWCPLCLAIIGVLYGEMFLVYGFLFNENIALQFDVQVIVLCISILLFLSSFWLILKPIFLKNKELKEQNAKNTRFKRNYSIFKKLLVEKEKYEFPVNEYSIILGNMDATTTIQIITNPFCGHCKKAHEILHDIVSRYHKKIKIHIIFNLDVSDNENKNLNVFRKLHKIFIQKGKKQFEVDLAHLFETPTKIEYIKDYKSSEIESKIDDVLKIQYEFCLKNDFNFTPNIFINGYEFPDLYERQDLKYFIPELIEDKF